jgi:nitrous oxide reductase accessory protein NosL
MVKDYDSGDLIDVRKAVYVRAVKKFRTPMGWGVAAFRENKRAAEFCEVMDSNDAGRVLK